MEEIIVQYIIIAHVIAAVIGAGAAFSSDWIFLSAICDFRLSKDEYRLLSRLSVLVWIGLVLLFGTGLALLLTNPDQYLSSEKFWLKMAIVAVIAVNGAIVHLHHMPFLKNIVGKSMKTHKEVSARSTHIIFHGAISIISWLAALILGSLRELPLPLFIVLTVYIIAIALAWGIGVFMKKRFFCQC